MRHGSGAEVFARNGAIMEGVIAAGLANNLKDVRARIEAAARARRDEAAQAAEAASGARA